MIKHFIKLYNKHTYNKKFRYLKLEITEYYDSLLKKMKELEPQDWEEDYFKGVLISLKADVSSESPQEIVTKYTSNFLEKQNYDALEISTNFFYKNKYNLLFTSYEEYFLLNKIIFEKQTAVLNLVSNRARNVILRVTEDVVLSTAAYNTYSYKGEA